MSTVTSSHQSTSRVISPAKYGEDKFIEVDGYKIHYVEGGRGQPTIFVPASFSTYRTWNRVLPLISGHCRFFAVDYLGVGDSDKPGKGFLYTVEEQADLLAKMAEKLGIGRVNLVGVSYGGAIVLKIAARYPGLVKRVVSIEGGVVKPESLPISYLEHFLKYPVISDLLLKIGRSSVLDRLFVRFIAGKWYPEMTPADKQELQEQIHYIIKTANRVAWYRMSTAHKISRAFDGEAKSINVPVLYLYGENSDFVKVLAEPNIRFFQKYLPDVRIIGIEGGIHNLELQKPREIASLLLNFFLENER